MKDFQNFYPQKNSTFWQNKRVLITGHTGFKGSWLSLWLLNLGAKIIGYSLQPEELSLFPLLNIESDIENHYDDIRNLENLQKIVLDYKPDIIFHLAAQPLVRKSYKEPINTWSTNVLGTINLLSAANLLENKCATIFITTDKVYKNREWEYGYREEDPLGGFDPYSGSKAASEIAISSWRSSFCGSSKHQKENIFIASARAGNVIGGGDWSKDRIVPDIVNSLSENKPISIRNPNSTRPWQHVLEPISGYLCLAKALYDYPNMGVFDSSFNFGPNLESNRKVLDLAKCSLNFWEGQIKIEKKSDIHEAGLLNLNIDKAHHKLGWSPTWQFEKTIEKTIVWYKKVINEKCDPYKACFSDLSDFNQDVLANNL